MHTIIAFDNKGNNESSFFQLCGDETRSLSVNAKIDYTNIETDRLTPDCVHTEVTNIKGDIVFAAFSHGDEQSLVNSTTKEIYLSNNINNDIFEKALIYTFSCNTAHTLGLELHKNGAKSYWGYKGDAEVRLQHEEEFSECAIEGLKALYDGKTVSESLEQMIQIHTENIEKLYLINPEAAGALVNNRESLVVYGELNMKIL